MEWWKQRWLVFKIVAKYCYLQFLQHIYITVIHLHKNTYEIQYVLHDKIYKVRTKVRRGPPRIVQILDHLDNDITDEVQSYLGPNEDFHGQCICPQDMGYERVYFCFRNGNKIGFDTQEPIIIS